VLNDPEAIEADFAVSLFTLDSFQKDARSEERAYIDYLRNQLRMKRYQKKA